MSSPMWDWFGLSYSSYLVLPRSLLCGMPEEWQVKMVALIDEMRKTYDSNKIDDNYDVILRDEKGRFKADPLSNYRHPPKLPYVKKSRPKPTPEPTNGQILYGKLDNKK